MEASTPRRHDGRPAADHTPDAEQLAGLYAFGVLDGADLARFERHLADCGRCAEVVAGDRAMVDVVGLATPEVAAAPDLKERLLRRAAAEGAQSGSGAGPASSTTGAVVPLAGRRARSWTPLWLLPLAAAVLLLFAASGLISGQIQSAQVVATAPLENRTDRGRAEVLVRASGEGVIQLSGFDDLTDGRVYQAWVIRPNQQPLATGASTSGNGALSLDGDVRGVRVAVTLEPGPGATAPSQRPFVVGTAPA